MDGCLCTAGAGEEPLLCKAEGRDVNSVAGVLKLYFRELREPLFPVQMFDQLIACSKYDVNGMTFCVKILWIGI